MNQKSLYFFCFFQTSDTESAGSGIGGNDDCVSIDRVRFDDNVSFIEATSSPSLGSTRSEKATDSSQQSDVKVNSDKTSLRSLLHHSGASTSSGDKKVPKLHKTSPQTVVDLSGIEISVDGKPLEVVIEPICVNGDSVTASFEVSIPVEVDGTQPSTLEVSSL